MISRRDFLKMTGVIAAGSLASERLLALGDAERKPNTIIILCDALSAMHLSLYGYPRRTSPNLDTFAEQCTVYHAHYSGGNFTTTGTACMLTGMHAWKHRAINYGGLVRPEFVRSNPYSLLGSGYQRFGFSQNPWPDRLMGQYQEDVDRFLSPAAYSLLSDRSSSRLFENDRALASLAMEDFLVPAQDDSLPGSALFGYINKSMIINATKERESIMYPHGFPEIMDPGYFIPYRNEQVYAGVYSELTRLNQGQSPYFAYFHLYSPHFPYRPRTDYRDYFRDDYVAPAKPIHPLSSGLSDDFAASQRLLYDRQLAQVDDEFGRLVARLEQDGLLDNSYLIFTADHGELFERGFVGHGFQFLYEPVLRIPLLVHAPGQTRRKDIHVPTSNIDLLPTLLSIATKQIPGDIDGRILPGLGGQDDPSRPIISMVGVDNSSFGPLKKGVISMHRDGYKLIAYLGYEDAPSAFELYDLENDPHELNNLTSGDPQRFRSLKNELFEYLDAANKSFGDAA